MKLSELKFKVITGTPERNLAVTNAMARIKPQLVTNEPSHAQYLRAAWLDFEMGSEAYRVVQAFSDMKFFDEDVHPEYTLPHLLNLIAQVEAPQPEFPFKAKDWCMGRDGETSYWRLGIFSHATKGNSFKTTGNAYYQIAKLDENLLGTAEAPDEWWENEDGKLVLRRKE